MGCCNKNNSYTKETNMAGCVLNVYFEKCKPKPGKGKKSKEREVQNQRIACVQEFFLSLSGIILLLVAYKMSGLLD